MKEQLGQGILTWDRYERKFNRYGSVALQGATYYEDARAQCGWFEEPLERLTGKRVRLTATVLESRKSRHVGDTFLHVFPTQPTVGEVIDFGIGILEPTSNAEDDRIVMLRPEDGRQMLWIDPRKLYRAHDQTVLLFAEETEQPCSAAPTGFDTADSGAEDLGGGAFQVKLVDESAVSFAPETKSLGDGMFSISFPSRKGRRLPLKA